MWLWACQALWHMCQGYLGWLLWFERALRRLKTPPVNSCNLMAKGLVFVENHNVILGQNGPQGTWQHQTTGGVMMQLRFFFQKPYFYVYVEFSKP